MTDPTAAESAIAEPEIAPNAVDDETVTTPSPPGRKPNKTLASSINLRPMPPLLINSPARINNGIAARWSGSTPPRKVMNMDSSG